MMHWNNWHMGWMGIWWGLVAVAVVALIWLATSRRGGGAGDSPERILKRRYANGELDAGTYRRMLDELRE